MSVLSQVHIAWHQRFYAERAFKRADEICRVQTSIDKHVENAVKSRSETQLEAVRTRVETLLAKRARDMSYAEMLNAQDAIYQAAGFDTVPSTVTDQSLDGLSEAIAAQDRAGAHGAVLQALYGSEAHKNGEGDYAAQSESFAMKPEENEAPAGAVRLVRGEPWESLGSLRGN